MQIKLCRWHLRTKRGYKYWAAVVRFETKPDRICVISAIINPYTKNGLDYSEAFNKLVTKYKLTSQDIVNGYPNDVLISIKAKEIKTECQ